MTREEAIKRLKWFKEYNEEDYCGGDRIQDEYGDWYYKVNEDDFEAFRQAADTMRKYQKIQEIVKGWNDMNSFDSMVQISEVVEDGKTD